MAYLTERELTRLRALPIKHRRTLFPLYAKCDQNIAETQADIAALKTIVADDRIAGLKCTVVSGAGGDLALYGWSATSTAIADDVNVVRPTDVLVSDPGRWLLLSGGSSGGYVEQLKYTSGFNGSTVATIPAKTVVAPHVLHDLQGDTLSQIGTNWKLYANIHPVEAHNQGVWEMYKVGTDITINLYDHGGPAPFLYATGTAAIGFPVKVHGLYEEDPFEGYFEVTWAADCLDLDAQTWEVNRPYGLAPSNGQNGFIGVTPSAVPPSTAASLITYGPTTVLVGDNFPVQPGYPLFTYAIQPGRVVPIEALSPLPSQYFLVGMALTGCNAGVNQEVEILLGWSNILFP